MNRTVFASLTILCLLSVSSITGLIQAVKADGGTIYIEPDGSIYPVGSPISSWNNVTYWLTSNASSPIVILRDNIFFNGSGYEILGSGSGYGINVTQRTNVTITNVEVTGFDYGIWLYESSNCSLTGNNLTENNWEGITLYYSDKNVVSGNKATNDIDDSGIWVASSAFNTISLNEVSGNHIQGLYVDHESHDNLFCENNVTNNNGLPWTYGIYTAPYSYNNTFIGNNIANNPVGIYIHLSSNNTIFHNNFIANILHVYVEGNTPNIWDNGNEGNYWDNYTGPDLDHNGIGDTPYAIDANNTDRYPLMGRFQNFTVSKSTTDFQPVDALSNSTISNFQFNGTAITFNADGENGTTGFCRICIPTALINGTFKVFVNGTEVSYTLLPETNSTNSYLYFTYHHSTQEIIITPEFPPFLILPLFFITTLFLAIICKKRRQNRFFHAST